MNIKKKVMTAKAQFLRGYSYVAALGIGFLVSDALKNYIPLPIYVLYPISVIVVWGIGFADTRFKMMDEEAKFMYKRYPQIVEMQLQLDKILEKVDRLK